MFNPVIIGALVIQAIVRNISSIAGAIFGYIITTGILIWGLSVYAEGNIITFFSIPLSKQIFLYAVFAWYWLEKNEKSQSDKLDSEIDLHPTANGIMQ